LPLAETRCQFALAPPIFLYVNATTLSDFEGTQGIFVQRSCFAQNLRVAARFAIALFFLASFSSRLSAQDSPAPATNPPPSAGNVPMRDVTDELGRKIQIPQTIHRVVSLAPSITETLYALGVQDRLIADSDYCDFPPEAKQKPHVGGTISPSIETIASLHPDVVLVTKGINRLDTVNSLASLGIPSYALDPHSVAEILTSTQRLAELMGAAQAGDTLATALRRQLAETQQRVAPFPPRRVLYVVWPQPLISIGQDTFMADALRYSGAISIVNEPQSWPQISLEEVAREQPEFLVFSGSHMASASVNIEALAESPGWRLLSAVREHRYANTSEAIERTSPRIVSAIADLARQFHPEAFKAGLATPVETDRDGQPLAPTGDAPVPTEVKPTPKPPQARLGLGDRDLGDRRELACAR
jgi:iron complex transport system substrate-binding protein